MIEPNNSIPFNKPFIVGKELHYISQAVLRGRLAGNGYFSKKCEYWMQEAFKANRVLLTTSGTAALEMAAILANLEDGDEVILPSYTFVSTANAFLRCGANLKFVDIRPDTLNMDETLLEDLITKRTKVIVPVHYAGVACEMKTIMDIASRHGILVVEDAAQAVHARYKDDFLGTIGDLGAYSFHETKNFICGEGGALVINNKIFLERAEIIHEKGTNRSKFFRGEVSKYTWVDEGSSFLPSEIISAFLYAQLEEADKITSKREAIYRYYYKALKPLSQKGYIQLPHCPEGSKHNGHMFYIILEKSKHDRDHFISHMNRSGIHAVFHYVPLHTSPMGRTFWNTNQRLKVTEDISQRLIRLPCYYELTRDDQDKVIEKINSYFSNSWQRSLHREASLSGAESC
ncbi:dTDP-4-amino-4,6-dideoxygalactose transaminase [Pseudobacteriovorax antillogorgiicola]|uniref:dTDP-4-amino-4,6-dideoxygalactose transaminase n=1 Tax=Pseudobacteriovorax antillogorgiicola TaxID=1513793 RepID=A0A1Y6CLL4_9BACT|nr:dTDP-4-amino-4,6-dideoxygalactose transaminase [Pseudobacteriovorax antillogorgiicola]TCS45179.1 dTDP-4-amino-4,6-dideoxygalactose transaminase [Pseudobacteriovorax antillogorgiicola]SMF75739.1 dTDP-4-amino-4,6-dideoxygalactose transaminase [Pseudobacteriovorax antillogorgiicola]